MSEWIYDNTEDARRHPATELRKVLRGVFKSGFSAIGFKINRGLSDAAGGKYCEVHFDGDVIAFSQFIYSGQPSSPTAHLNAAVEKISVLYPIVFIEQKIYEWKILLFFEPWKTGHSSTLLSIDDQTGRFQARSATANVEPKLISAALYGGPLVDASEASSPEQRRYTKLSKQLHAHLNGIFQKNDPSFELVQLQSRPEDNLHHLHEMITAVSKSRTSMKDMRPVLYGALVAQYPGTCTLSALYDVIHQQVPLTASDMQPAGPNTNEPAWKRQLRNVLQKDRERGVIVRPEPESYQASAALWLQHHMPDFLNTPIPDEHRSLLAYVRQRPQMIFSGPPGTGKTRLARQLAIHVCLGQEGMGWTENDADIDRLFNQLVGSHQARLVVFHPSYEYSTFIGGMAVNPDVSDDGDRAPFVERDGIFLGLVSHARRAPEQTFVLIIDEINRGNLPRLFGELIYGLEYRNTSITLSYKGMMDFQIPSNLIILGTMNSADQSVAPLDIAIRRRFGFHQVLPKPGLLSTLMPDDWSTRRAVMTAVNEAMRSSNPDYMVGHSYFLRSGDTQSLWAFEIRPLLLEYCYRLGLDEHHVLAQISRHDDWNDVQNEPLVQAALMPDA